MDKTVDILSTRQDESMLASWAQAIQPSALQKLLPITANPEVISFALGLPAMDLFPIDMYTQAILKTLKNKQSVLQYGPTSHKLKLQIVQLMEQRGVKCRVEQIFLTAGAQQGISLLTRLLLNPGGQVLTETITYPGILQIIAPYQPELFTIPTNYEAGIDVNTLEQVLRKGARPAFIYMVTDGHNPLGVSLNLTKRKRLVELACQYRIPILEDDPYGFLAYDGASLPPLRAFDEQWVYYIGSCSKILAPSLRVGWIVVPENLIHRLSATKETIDLDTATFAQHTVSTLLESDLFSKHIEMLQKEYKVRRDAMHQALQSEFSVEDVQWRKPTNGLYFWVKFAKTIDTEAFLKMAITDERVAFLPGQSFCATAGTRAAHCARLNFSSNPPERIREGIARFARAVRCFNHWK